MALNPTKRVQIAAAYGLSALVIATVFYWRTSTGLSSLDLVLASVVPMLIAALVAAMAAPLIIGDRLSDALFAGLSIPIVSHVAYAIVLCLRISDPISAIGAFPMVFGLGVYAVGWITVPVGGALGFLFFRTANLQAI